MVTKRKQVIETTVHNVLCCNNYQQLYKCMQVKNINKCDIDNDKHTICNTNGNYTKCIRYGKIIYIEVVL